MARPRTAKDRAMVTAANAGKSGAQVQRILDGVGPSSFDEARADYRHQLDASDPGNRFMRRRQGLGGSGDYHIPEQRLWYVRETSRHMALNDDLVGSMFRRLADNIVQEAGFRLVSNTGDPVLDDEIEARHCEWACDPRKCDFFAQRTFAQLQWMVQYLTDQDGDVFALPIDDGTLQLVEADRCTSLNQNTDREYLGLLYDDVGRVKTYRFARKPLGQYQTKAFADTRLINRFDGEGYEQVLHNYDAVRVTQHRGMPILTPVMIKSGMLDDLQFATVVKAQSAAAHAIFFKRPVGAPAGAPPRAGIRSTTTATAADGSTQSIYTDAIRYGTAVTLPPGVEPAVLTAPIPNNEHLAHVRDTIRQIGAAVGLPLELVLLDASNTNFSGWRGAMDAARMGFRRRQQDRIAQFLTPAHRLNVRRWAYAMGSTAVKKFEDGSLFGHRWVPASWPYINPKEDAEAAQVLMRSGQESPRSLLARRGQDYDDVVRETVEDRKAAYMLAIEACDDIKAKTGYVLAPMTLLGWDLPANSALITQTDEVENTGGAAPAQPGVPAAKPAAEPEPAEPAADKVGAA